MKYLMRLMGKSAGVKRAASLRELEQAVRESLYRQVGIPGGCSDRGSVYVEEIYEDSVVYFVEFRTGLHGFPPDPSINGMFRISYVLKEGVVEFIGQPQAVTRVVSYAPRSEAAAFLNMPTLMGTVELSVAPGGKAVVRPLGKGGPGSGNFGHAGRPGEVGGSAGGGGSGPGSLKDEAKATASGKEETAARDLFFKADEKRDEAIQLSRAGKIDREEKDMILRSATAFSASAEAYGVGRVAYTNGDVQTHERASLLHDAAYRYNSTASYNPVTGEIDKVHAAWADKHKAEVAAHRAAVAAHKDELAKSAKGGPGSGKSAPAIVTGSKSLRKGDTVCVETKAGKAFGVFSQEVDGGVSVELLLPSRDSGDLFHTKSVVVLTPDAVFRAPSSAKVSEKFVMVKAWEGVAPVGFPDRKTPKPVYQAPGDKETPIVDYRGVTIEGYLSTFVKFTPKDRDGDYVMKGAFDKTLRRFRENPVMLSDHTNLVPNLSGSFDVLEVKDKGLYVRGRVSDAPDQISVRFKIAEGHLKSLSMGGLFLYAHDGKGIEEVELWEGSLTPVPANPDAQFMVRAYTEIDAAKAVRFFTPK